MKSFSFKANCVALEHPDGICHLVGFADEKYDTRNYLMLQRSFEGDDDDQDRALGMDTYHVEWCGQEHSGYGGITNCVLTPDLIDITFDAKGSDMFGLERISIAFQLPPSEQASLRAALVDIFAGSGALTLDPL